MGWHDKSPASKADECDSCLEVFESGEDYETCDECGHLYPANESCGCGGIKYEEDPEPTDAQHPVIFVKLPSDFANSVEQIVSSLCSQSLRLKWNANSVEKIETKCPFCTDAIERAEQNDDDGVYMCIYCLCPREICSMFARGGKIHELEAAHGGEIKIHALPAEDLASIVDLFKKHVKKNARKYSAREAELAKESLEKKWFAESQAVITDKCPFCYSAEQEADESDEDRTMCDYCLCPREICTAFAKGGFIARLIEKYHDGKMVCEISAEDLATIRGMFQEIIDNSH